MPVPKRLERPARAVWERTEREFAFPFLALELVEQASPPARLLQHRIQISAPFVRGMSEIGVVPETAISLLAAREVNAWIRVPSTFNEYMELYAAVRQAVYSETASSRFNQAYFDVWNDLDLCRHHGIGADIQRVYRASLRSCGTTAEDTFYQVLAATLAAKADIELEVHLDSVHGALVEELAALDYLQPADRPAEIRAFAAILGKVFFFRPGQRATDGTGTGGTASGGGKAAAKQAQPRWPLGADAARDLGGMAGLEGGIARFTGKLTDTDTSDLLLEALSRLGASGIAVAGFRNGRPWWYRELARKIPIKVQRKLAREAAPAIPVDLTPWVPEDDTGHINPFASMGRLASPGITQRWRISGEDSQYQTFVLPSLLILIDSSGSMPNPATVLSYPALAGVVVASTYLSHGSLVSVYNFSDADLVCDFTGDEADMLKHITAFKCGGTEVIKREIVETLLGSPNREGREVDILLITDMQMSASELDLVMQLVREHQEVHRLFLLVKGPKAADSHERFAGTRVKVYTVDSEDDIAHLALGVMAESTGS
jgi:hypothetical protein